MRKNFAVAVVVYAAVALCPAVSPSTRSLAPMAGRRGCRCSQGRGGRRQGRGCQPRQSVEGTAEILRPVVVGAQNVPQQRQLLAQPSESLKDIRTGLMFRPVDFQGARVHCGFLSAFNAIAKEVRTAVETADSAHPFYIIGIRWAKRYPRSRA